MTKADRKMLVRDYRVIDIDDLLGYCTIDEVIDKLDDLKRSVGYDYDRVSFYVNHINESVDVELRMLSLETDEECKRRIMGETQYLLAEKEKEYKKYLKLKEKFKDYENNKL